MLKVRILSLLVLSLVLAGSSLASQGTLTENNTTNNGSISLEDKAYFQEVIIPAKDAGTMTAEQREWFIAYKQRLAEVSDQAIMSPNPRRDDRCDPDDAGYYWLDNDEEDGPEFGWLSQDDFDDVRSWNLGDDENTGAVDLGFTFPFWDQEYDQVYIDTDGYLSFTYAGTAYNIAVANFPVEANAGAIYHSMICVRQVDFGNSQLWFWTDDEMAVIWWCGNGSENYQTVLHSNGEILIQTGEGCGARNMGVNLGDGDHGWFIGSYANGSAIAISPGLEYEEGAGITLRPEELAFGDAFVDQIVTLEINIMNNGSDDLVIDAISCDNEVFGVPELDEELILASLERVALEFTFTPDGEDDFADDVTIHSNAVDQGADGDGNTFVPVSGRGLLAPDIFVEPVLIEDSLNTGDIEEHRVTIENRGNSDLLYEVDVEVTAEPGDDEERGPRRDRRGDPDDFGCEWRDNLEDDGPEFEWIDIREWDNVTTQVQSDDQINGPFVFGWDMPFYDQAFDRVWICSDGWISFQRSEYARGVPDIPNNDQSWFATVLWADGDWHGGDGLGFESGPVYFWTNEEDMAIVTYNQWYSRYQQPCADIQIIMNADGMIKIQYGQDFGLDGNNFNNGQYGSEAGINGLGGDMAGFQFNASGQGEDYLLEGLAIQFGPPSAWISWIAVEPTEGTIEPDDADALTVTLDANELIEGDYAANVTITHNDPDDEAVIVVVEMFVTGAPNILVEWDDDYGFPDVVDWNAAYPDLYTGGPYTMILNVANNGTAELNISDISCEHEYFSAEPAELLEMAPDDEAEVTITFNADEAGDYDDATVVFTSNDPGDEHYTVNLHARALRPPTFVIDPDIHENYELFTGNTEDVRFVIENTGNAPLRFTVDHEIIVDGPDDRDANARTLRSTDRALGPRRDPLEDNELDGLLFCCFQTSSTWGWVDDGMRQDPLLNEDNYHSYHNAGDWDEVDFDEYDVVVVAGRDNMWSQNMADNFERFEEYIDGGGAAYYEVADENSRVHSPGDISNDNANGTSNGVLVVSPYPEDDNYSLLADIFHRSEPDYWEEGEIIEGSSWLHSGYNMGQFEDKLEDGTIEWYQVIANLQNQDVAGCVAYGYGRGTVVTVGHPTGHVWFNWARDGGQWGSMAAELLLYLVESTGGWLSYEVDEGEIEPDDAMEWVLNIDCEGLFGGNYEADLLFTTNEPPERDDRVHTIPILLEVTGAPDIEVSWPDEYGFADNLLDWNARWDPNCFNGFDLEMYVTIDNVGTDVLEVAVQFDGHEVFYVAEDDESFEVAAGDSKELEVILHSEEPDDYFATMILTTNDDDERTIEIDLSGETFDPPLFWIDPDFIETVIITPESERHVLEVENRGDAALSIQIEHEIISEPERDADARSLRSMNNAVGPRRDDPGDLIASVDGINLASNYTHPAAYDWDNERMWITGYTNSWARAYTYDNDYENFESQVQIAPGMCMDGAWLNGIYYTHTNGNTVLTKWDADGQSLGQVQFPHNIYGSAADVEESYLLLQESGNNYGIHVYEVDGDEIGDQIGLINNWTQFNNGQYCYGFEWVAKHPEGQLWVHHYSQHTVTQIFVDTDEWQAVEAIQSFNVGNISQVYDHSAHDGHNLWVGGYPDATIRIYDDGVTEVYWLMYEPTVDTLASGEAMEITVDLITEGLIAGEYEADLIFWTNDLRYRDGFRLPIIMTTVGTAHINAEWVPGYIEDNVPESVVDFNIAFDPDMFTGGPYSIPVTIINESNSDLEISNIQSDEEENPMFTADPTELTVPAYDDRVVNFIFEAPFDEPGDYNQTMIIYNNDHDEDDQEFEIAVHAEVNRPPILTLNPAPDDGYEFQEDMTTGEVITHDVVVGNDGESMLWFETEVVVISEPGDDERDRDARSLRSTNRAAGPRRDDPGDLLGSFNGINGGSQYCSLLGWDSDAEVMWMSNYSNQTIAAYSHDNNYENFEEVVRINYGGCMDGGVYGGLAWIGVWSPTSLNRYDINGDMVGAIQFPTSVYGLAFDQENELCFHMTSEANQPIRVYQMDGMDIGEQIGNINNHYPYHNNIYNYGLEWVPAHGEAPLWMFAYNNGMLYQIGVDQEEWQCIDYEDAVSFNAYNGNAGAGYGGAGHDGENIWCAGYTPADIRIYDDGVKETRWISIVPHIMELEEPIEIQPGGEDVVMDLWLNAANLFGGEYIAEIQFFSNDPIQPQVPEAVPDGILDVMIDVTPAPDLTLDWFMGHHPRDPEDPPEFIDWNQFPDYNPDLYVEHDYAIVVTCANEGTDDLEISLIVSDDGEGNENEHFWVDFDEEIILSPDEEQDVNLLFHSDDPAEFPAEDEELYMRFVSTDPSEQELLIPIHARAYLPPVLSVEPQEIDEILFTGEVNEYPINVSNQGEADLVWYTKSEIIREPEEGGRCIDERGLRSINNAVGPRRDDAGDIIAEFAGPNRASWYISPVGWDPDNDVMFITEYSASMIHVWTHNNYEDFEEVRSFGTPNPMDGGFYEGIIYICNLNVNANLRRFDFEGNALDDLAMGFSTYGVAFDTEEGWMFARNQSAAGVIQVYEMDGNDRGEQIATLPNPTQFNGGNANLYNIEWVALHPDGQMWITNNNGSIYQIAVNTDDWEYIETVQSFQVGTNQPYDACTHDGEHIWIGGYGATNVRIYDDGITEMRWLMWDPECDTLTQGSDIDVIVTLDARGLFGGEYIAELRFFSNDPTIEDYLAVNVAMEVVPVPNIDVTPGGPEVDDGEQEPPVDFGEVYVGYPELYIVQIENTGTDDLEIYEVVFEDESVFWIDDEDVPDVLAPEEIAEVPIEFAPPLPDNHQDDPVFYEEVIHFLTNDARYQEDNPYPVRVEGWGLDAPILRLGTNEVDEDIFAGEVLEVPVSVSNEGGSELVFETDIEIMNEPERDAGIRTLRSTDRAIGPRRDDPVDLEGLLFCCFETNNGWNNGMYQGFLNCEQRLNDDNFHSYRNAGDWNDVEFDDYDVVCVNAYSQPWVAEYNNNLERFEEYIDGGGATYFETADANRSVSSPGGIINDFANSSSNGVLVVSPNPNDEDYSLFAELAQGAQPDNWNRGEVIEGNAWVHSGYNLAQFEDGVEEGTLEWYQVIADQQQNQVPGAVAYGYGGGAVLTCAHPVGFGCVNYAGVGNWHGIVGEFLYYLVEMTGPNWIELDPPADTLAPFGDMDVIFILNAEGLIAGPYEADVKFLCNDPTVDPVEGEIVTVLMTVEGAAFLSEDAEQTIPLPDELGGDPVQLPPAYYEVDPELGGASRFDIILANFGSEELTFDEIVFDPDDGEFDIEFEGDPEVPAFEDKAVTLIFTPAALGERSGTITFHTNAQNEGLEDGVFHYELLAIGQEPPSIWIDPDNDFAVSLNVGDDPITRPFIIGNDEGEWRRDLTWEISFEEPDEDERDASARTLRSTNGAAVGPRRDVEGLFAIFQDLVSWGWYEEWVFRLVDEIEYDNYNNANDLEEVELDDYDALWIATGEMSAQFTQNWNDNLERFEDYVSHGGVMFIEQGWNGNHVGPIIGGLQDTRTPQEGQLAPGLGEGGDEENWLVDQMGWRQNQAFPGGSTFHCVYPEDDLDEIEDCDWYQVIAIGTSTNQPGIVAYEYGRGFVIVSGSPTGHQWRYHNIDGQWGSCGETLLEWMIMMAVPGWIEAEPEEGITSQGEQDEVTLTINPEGLDEATTYTVDLIVESNDPEQQDPPVSIRVSLTTVAPCHYFPENFPRFVETGYMHTWTVNELTFVGNPVPNYWEIGAFAPEPEDNLSGAAIWIDGFNVELTLYGDNPVTEGVIEGFVGGDEIVIRLWDPEAEQEFNARVEFLDGPEVWVNNGESTVNIDGLDIIQQDVLFRGNWNMVSLNIIPDPDQYEYNDEGPEVEDMCRQALWNEDDGWLLLQMKNATGDFCVPVWPFWDIDYWNPIEGYLMRVVGDPQNREDDFVASWTGIPIHPQTEFDVGAGWSMIPYYPDYDLNARFGSGYYVIPEDVLEHLIIAKDGTGDFMMPDQGFSNMDPWTPGQGYQVNLREAVSWVYPAEQDEQAAVASNVVKLGTHWIAPNSAENMSVLVTSVAGLAVEDGDQIAAFNNGRLVGAGTVSEGRCGLAVWGDIEFTEDIVEGMLPGKAFELRLWDADKDVEMNLSVNQDGNNALVYETDGFIALNVTVEPGIPDEFYLTQNYPNPFNAITHIAYGLPEASKVTIQVYDVTGRLVTTLVNNELKAGHHMTIWNGHATASGIYIVRMEAAGFKSARKVMLVK